MVLWASELASYLGDKPFYRMAQDLLEELGMLDSTFVSKKDENLPEMKIKAKPYYMKDDKPVEMNPELIKRLATVQAIGGLYVSPNDMSRFLRILLNRGSIDGVQIVPEQVMNWLTKATTIYPNINFKTNADDIFETPLAYGLGAMIGSYNGWQRFSHNGFFTPYRSEISWYPGRKLGIFTATHEAPSLIKHQVLHAFILETLLEYDNAAERATKQMEAQHLLAESFDLGKEKILQEFLGHSKMAQDDQIRNGTEGVKQLLGVYGNSVSGDVEVSEKYNVRSKQPELYLSYGNWAKGWLENLGGEAHQVRWDNDLAQDYQAGGDKDGMAYVYLRKNGSLEFVRPTHMGMITYAQFKKGETFDKLNHSVWTSNMC